MKRKIGVLIVVGILTGCAGEKGSTVKELDEFDGKGDKAKTSRVLDDQKKNREDALKKLDDEADKN